jgi:hypothetical protein
LFSSCAANEVGASGAARLAEASIALIEQKLKHNKKMLYYVKKMKWSINHHHQYYPHLKFHQIVKTLMTAIMVTNQATMMVIPKELVCLVIELLGSDPVWWLEEKEGRGRRRGEKKKKREEDS